MKKRQTTVKKHPVHRKVGRRVKLVVLPHAANDFHPHLIRWYGIVSMLILTLIAVVYAHPSPGGVLGVKANITAAGLLKDTNRERSKAGGQPLEYDEQLANAAYLKANDMLKRQYWAHNAPDGTTPWQWFTQAGYNYSYAGENLAKNFTTTSATVSAWMASKAHRENILNEYYTDVGFAVVDGTLDGKPTTLVVALYGAPASHVAGVYASTMNASDSTMNIVSRLGVTLQTMSPALLGSVVLLVFGVLTSLVAYAYRKRLPKAVRRSWKYYHGIFKAVGLTVFTIVLVALYSNGQI